METTETTMQIIDRISAALRALVARMTAEQDDTARLLAQTPDQREDIGLTLSDLRMLGA